MLLGMAMNDAVMPNTTTYALARALGVPMVETVLAPQVGLTRVESPVLGDLDGVTGGLVQFDVIDAAGALADHNSLAESTVGYEAWTHFLDTHFAGNAEIRDPYQAIGLAHP
jgi:hypothetical protein